MAQRFNFFQTVEVTDFERTFSSENLQLLQDEIGGIIVHCYFTSPLSYQIGKLFDKKEISPKNVRNFMQIGELVQMGKLWNPTISELSEYFQEFESNLLDHDFEQKLNNNKNLPIRLVKYDF